ncbi:Adenosine deaminase-like protein [Galemys pyrenaicus]|uniref:Adenosine deaminase-like protein n=1 Tax=Galemys pyrenaicus TaxID=202257 RepID=A0A8J6A4P2_GALPY|nr:Adenosine deaminase-like protein [Galemys pyrenaicus]
MIEAEEQQQPRKSTFYSELPKVELHAHLNGSISSNTMKKLIAKKPDLKVHGRMTVIDKGNKRTLEECFEMFPVIHQLTTGPEDILMITKDVIKEFADDGVKYLELRSTPRADNSTGMTKKTYVESVLEGIRQCKEENLDVDVRYLIAIDRKAGPSVAKETVKLAEEYFLSTEDIVLGVDLSGDPTIPNQTKETQVLLDLLPDRIGHGTFLNSSEGESLDLVNFVRQHRIPLGKEGEDFKSSRQPSAPNFFSPQLATCMWRKTFSFHLELCLTSNIKSQTVRSYDLHHFGFWYSIGHPSVICVSLKYFASFLPPSSSIRSNIHYIGDCLAYLRTDDKGVFATTLSQEYQLAAETFHLTQSQVWNLSYESIDYIFASDCTRSELKKKWNHLKPRVLHF